MADIEFEGLAFEEVVEIWEALPDGPLKEKVWGWVRDNDPETLAERRYFDMCDPAYVKDLTTPYEETLAFESEYESRYDYDGPEEDE